MRKIIVSVVLLTILSIWLANTAEAQSVRIYTENLVYTKETDIDAPKELIDNLVGRHKAAFDGYVKTCVWDHSIVGAYYPLQGKFILTLDSYCDSYNDEKQSDEHNSDIKIQTVGWVYFQETDTEELKTAKIEALKSWLSQISECLSFKISYMCIHNLPKILGISFRKSVEFHTECPGF